jgi:UMF1 family MFS transporter
MAEQRSNEEGTHHHAGPGERRAIWGWAIYDWANSAFATTVMAGFFPLFFKQYWSQGVEAPLSTARLGFGNAAASLAVALLAPLLGAIADRGGLRKRFLLLFAALGVLGTALLHGVGAGAWQAALALYALAILGFSGANVFYDALLPHVAPRPQLDRVSSLGYALGYLGGGLLFAVNVLMTLHPSRFGLPDAAAAVRWAFLGAALWWGGFTLFTAAWVPSDRIAPPAARPGRSIAAGLRRLAGTLRELRRLRQLSLFLAAYWCYIDGVDTIIRMAVDYGISLGFAPGDLMAALLLVQFIGFPAALLFARLGAAWGVRRAILLAIAAYGGITLWGALISRRSDFFALAAAIGLFQGGIQALSRSFFARLIPPGRSAEFFGFYNLLGKMAAIVGPALVAATGLLVRAALAPPDGPPEAAEAASRLASRWGMAAILVLFAAGALLFSRVDEARGKAEAQALPPAD